MRARKRLIGTTLLLNRWIFRRRSNRFVIAFKKRFMLHHYLLFPLTPHWAGMSARAMCQLIRKEIMMVVVHAHDDAYQRQSAPVLELFPCTSQVQGNDLPALIGDFFDWLETAWKLPFSSADRKRVPLPVPLALAEEIYTVADLSRLYGYHPETIPRMLKRSGIFPSQYGKSEQSSLYKR